MAQQAPAQLPGTIVVENIPLAVYTEDAPRKDECKACFKKLSGRHVRHPKGKTLRCCPLHCIHVGNPKAQPACKARTPVPMQCVHSQHVCSVCHERFPAHTPKTCPKLEMVEARKKREGENRKKRIHWKINKKPDAVVAALSGGGGGSGATSGDASGATGEGVSGATSGGGEGDDAAEGDDGATTTSSSTASSYTVVFPVTQPCILFDGPSDDVLRLMLSWVISGVGKEQADAGYSDLGRLLRAMGGARLQWAIEAVITEHRMRAAPTRMVRDTFSFGRSVSTAYACACCIVVRAETCNSHIGEAVRGAIQQCDCWAMYCQHPKQYTGGIVRRLCAACSYAFVYLPTYAETELVENAYTEHVPITTIKWESDMHTENPYREASEGSYSYVGKWCVPKCCMPLLATVLTAMLTPRRITLNVRGGGDAGTGAAGTGDADTTSWRETIQGGCCWDLMMSRRQRCTVSATAHPMAVVTTTRTPVYVLAPTRASPTPASPTPASAHAPAPAPTPAPVTTTSLKVSRIAPNLARFAAELALYDRSCHVYGQEWERTQAGDPPITPEAYGLACDEHCQLYHGGTAPEKKRKTGKGRKKKPRKGRKGEKDAAAAASSKAEPYYVPFTLLRILLDATRSPWRRVRGTLPGLHRSLHAYTVARGGVLGVVAPASGSALAETALAASAPASSSSPALPAPHSAGYGAAVLALLREGSVPAVRDAFASGALRRDWMCAAPWNHAIGVILPGEIRPLTQQEETTEQTHDSAIVRLDLLHAAIAMGDAKLARECLAQHAYVSVAHGLVVDGTHWLSSEAFMVNCIRSNRVALLDLCLELTEIGRHTIPIYTVGYGVNANVGLRLRLFDAHGGANVIAYPLHLAARLGRGAIARILLQYGARIDQTTGATGSAYANINSLTAAHVAALCGNVGMLQFLRANGADMRALDYNECAVKHTKPLVCFEGTQWPHVVCQSVYARSAAQWMGLQLVGGRDAIAAAEAAEDAQLRAEAGEWIDRPVRCPYDASTPWGPAGGGGGVGDVD